MKFKIFYEIKHVTDSIILEGETIEEIQDKAKKIIEEKNPDNYWSEEVE